MSDVVLESGELPDGWTTAPIKDLGKAITGNTPLTKDPDNYGGDIPFLKPTELVDRPVSAGRKTISTKGAVMSRIIPKGGVLVSCIGNLGKTAIATRKVAFNQQINAVIFNESVIPEYGFYYFQSGKFRKDLESLASATTISIVNKSKFESIEVPVAPPEQQKRIVAKIEELFSHIDAGIEAIKKAKQLLKQYRQSVLKAAVTGELTKEWREANKDKLEPASKLLERILIERRRKWEEQQLEQFKAKGKMPKDDKWKEKYQDPAQSELHDLPELAREWQYVRLDLLADIQGGLTVDSNRKKAKTKRLPYLRVANVQRGYLDLSEMREIDVPEEKVKDLLLKDKDILFNEGGDRDKLGRGWVWHDEVRPCTYQNHVFRARPYSMKISSEFISIFGNTFGQDYFMKQGKQTTNLASINKTKLGAFPVPLCSKTEMDEIMGIVDEKLSAINRVESNINRQLLKAEKNKHSLLATAFAGLL